MTVRDNAKSCEIAKIVVYKERVVGRVVVRWARVVVFVGFKATF